LKERELKMAAPQSA